MPASSKEFRLRPKARADLEGIWLYTAERWSPAQADIYYAKLVEIMEGIAAGRLRGRSAEHIREGYFKYAAGSHFMFYRQACYGIDVIRILHQQMHVERHL